MDRRSIIVAPAALLLSGCVVAPADRGYGVAVAPALPMIVELDLEPYYFYSGFYYFYDNDRWRYSNSRSGPWMDLPRSHYPKEVRFRGRRNGRDGDRDRDRDRRDPR